MIPLRTRESFFRDPFFSDCWDLMDRRRKEWEEEVNLRSRSFLSELDDFDLGVTRGGLGSRSLFNRERDLLERDDGWKSNLQQSSSDAFGLQSDKDKFKVLLDVQQFNPEELSVKTCDNSITIEGKHEEKKDPHGFVSRHFTRQYTLPSDVKVDDVQCNLSSDGVLHVTAPRLNPAITNKTTTNGTSASTSATSSNAGSTTTAASSSRRSAERETHTTASTAKEYPEQRRTTPDREARRSTERELNKSSFGSLKDYDSRGRSRLFDSYFAGFPDFDLVPFWRRRDWSGGQGEIIERQTSNKTAMGVVSDRDNFKVQLDVQQFTPEELSVKTIDNFLVIEGKHEEKKDSLGWVTRHFTRKYEIPADVKPESVKCNFSSDGLLVVTAPRPRPQLTTNEKVTVIPIQVKHQSGIDSRPSVQQQPIRQPQQHQIKPTTSSVEEAMKEHVIRVDKEGSSGPVTTANGVQIEEHISRSSSNSDAKKEIQKQVHSEGIVSQPGELVGEHVIPIMNAA